MMSRHATNRKFPSILLIRRKTSDNCDASQHQLCLTLSSRPGLCPLSRQASIFGYLRILGSRTTINLLSCELMPTVQVCIFACQCCPTILLPGNMKLPTTSS